MSHFKERKEKNCLNCNAEVLGRYCQVCGQENIEPKESAWHLITHFFNDVTHFDGKFFSTVKYLLFKPGFLTYEYVRGKRTTYLHPIRLYVFTSAFFFLLYFSFISSHNNEKEGVEGIKDALISRQEERENLLAMRSETTDSTLKTAVSKAIIKYDKQISLLNDSLTKEEKKSDKENDNDDDDDNSGSHKTTIVTPQNIDEIKKVIDSATNNVSEENNGIKKIIDSSLHVADSSFRKKRRNTSEDFMDFEFYKDEQTYLAVQKELPKEKQDPTVERSIKQKLLSWHDKQKKSDGKMYDNVKEKFKHSFPTLLFISLPIFAFLLKLLYIRRKQFYYADHGIFTLHVYCATFILLLFYYLFDALKIKTDWFIFSLMKAAIVIYIMYYTYKAMRNFYEQGRAKTLFKYLFLGWMTSIVMFILILIFLIISAYKA